MKKGLRKKITIDPDEIFIDSQNLPEFDTQQFEGRLERPISLGVFVTLGVLCAALMLTLAGKAWALQVKDGAEYASMSDNNMTRQTIVFAERGAIYDRNGEKLAWNSVNPANPDFASREYIPETGFSHILGYLKYPAKDKSGFYYRQDYEGVAGIEKEYDSELKGEQGLKILGVDALGKTDAESTVRPAKDGQNLTLSIDAILQHKLFESIKELVDRVHFMGGTGAIMDVKTGEVLALASYPEYSSSVMTEGSDNKEIARYLTDPAKPFLNRFLGGLYTPGSIVKPYVAMAAQEEHTIDPSTQILSTGSISIPNPYDPTRKTVFNDWRPQGLVDMRHAIAVSSNVYFYEVGGGFEGQEGLGIARLDEYFAKFGFGRLPGVGFFKGPIGTVPSPAWKDKVFPGDPWRIGDTYFTSIGQYGWQVTPLQMLRAVTSVANGGTLIEPTILKVASTTDAIATDLGLDPAHFKVVREGMRLGAQVGTASGLNVPYIQIAAKTGTAELGVTKAFVNSWVTGFFPYDNPRYSFVVMMEHGPRTNIYGATLIMRTMFDWMHLNDSPYLSQ